MKKNILLLILIFCLGCISVSAQQSYVKDAELGDGDRDGGGLHYVLKSNGELWAWYTLHTYDKNFDYPDSIYSPNLIMTDVKQVNYINMLEYIVLKNNGDLWVLWYEEDQDSGTGYLPCKSVKINSDVKSCIMTFGYVFIMKNNNDLWAYELFKGKRSSIAQDAKTPILLLNNVVDINSMYDRAIIYSENGIWYNSFNEIVRLPDDFVLKSMKYGDLLDTKGRLFSASISEGGTDRYYVPIEEDVKDYVGSVILKNNGEVWNKIWVDAKNEFEIVKGPSNISSVSEITCWDANGHYELITNDGKGMLYEPKQQTVTPYEDNIKTCYAVERHFWEGEYIKTAECYLTYDNNLLRKDINNNGETKNTVVLQNVKTILNQNFAVTENDELYFINKNSVEKLFKVDDEISVLKDEFDYDLPVIHCNNKYYVFQFDEKNNELYNVKYSVINDRIIKYNYFISKNSFIALTDKKDLIAVPIVTEDHVFDFENMQPITVCTDVDDIFYTYSDKAVINIKDVLYVADFGYKVYMKNYNFFNENIIIKTPIPTEVYFNNQRIPLTLRIHYINNRALYPLRECLEAMGAKVSGDEQTQTAYGELYGKKVGFKIGSRKYTINDQILEMDVAPYIDQETGRTYIPLRYAAEGLGFSVEWVEGEDTNKIIVK